MLYIFHGVNIEQIEKLAAALYFHVMDSAPTSSLSNRLWFWLHFALIVVAWVGPFLFDWYLMVAGYGVVMIQFAIFNRCLMNNKHDLAEDGDMTFYAQLLEAAGFQFSRKRVKQIVRPWIYVFLSAFVITLQVLAGYTPLFHYHS